MKKMNLNSLDKNETAILKYILHVKKGAFTYMDIYRLAKILKISPDVILEALYELAEKKVVTFCKEI